MLGRAVGWRDDDLPLLFRFSLASSGGEGAHDDEPTLHLSAFTTSNVLLALLSESATGAQRGLFPHLIP